ncbi:hypothetical protein STENM223S_06619 [Streptomyces tendae]
MVWPMAPAAPTVRAQAGGMPVAAPVGGEGEVFRRVRMPVTGSVTGRPVHRPGAGLCLAWP